MFREKSLYYLVIFAILLCSFTTALAYHHEKEVFWASGPLVKKEERRTLVSTEYGQISAARVTDSINGSYLLHFFTLEPNALFLPAILHADMVFYIQTGSGRLSWTEEGNLKRTGITRGDVHRLQHGSVFFIQSNLETDQTAERQKLRIHAIFVNSIYDQHEPETGPYSSIRDMIIGFDRNVLQAAFKVPEDVIDDLLNGTKQPAIIHGVTKTKRKAWDREAQFISGILGSRSFNLFELNKKKKKDDANLFNIFKEDKDFENCNGWSTTVTKKLSALRDSNIGLFMVNLTTGSMMGPHWNPKATEIAIVLQGRGMVRVVCSSISNETSCRNTRYQVEEGDIFVVPRFHPMAQMAFNNETFVFMGFSTSAKRNHPQYLVGQASVLRTLDRDVMAMSFGVENTTFDQLLTSQHDSVILGCTSCAEEELRIIRKEREEAREREEEEARKREEEKKREEEEARKKEEEAARKQEEERRKREEEEEAARRREEEEETRKREEERKKEEAAAAKKEKEEREKREQEEEAARKEKEERRRREREETARREEEERERREQKEEEERQRHEQEEASAKREEEERQRREQEEAVSREEEEERERQEQESTATRREEEERERREQEEAERREEDVRQRHEQEEKAARREEKERHRREQEEAAARRGEDERQRQHKKEEASWREEQGGGSSEEEQAAEEERRMEKEARREEEEQGHGDIRGYERVKISLNMNIMAQNE